MPLLYSINSIIKQLHSNLEQVEVAAQLQGVTEVQYNELVAVAHAGITMVNSLKEGDVVSKDWILWRDKLVTMASSIIEEPAKIS